MRYRLKSKPSTPTVFCTVSPPRKRLSSPKLPPFGCRSVNGFWAPEPSSRGIRRRPFAAAWAVGEGDPPEAVCGCAGQGRSSGLVDRRAGERPRLSRERQTENELAEAV